MLGAISENSRLHLLQSIKDVNENLYFSTEEKCHNLYKVFELIFELGTAGLHINFTTLFSRIAFLSNNMVWPKNLNRAVHLIRKLHEAKIPSEEAGWHERHKLLNIVCLNLIATLNEERTEAIIIDPYFDNVLNIDAYQKTGFVSIVDGLLVDVDKEHCTIKYLQNTINANEVTVRYDVSGKNDLFTGLLNSLTSILPFPIPLNLIDVDIDEHGHFIPSAFVVFPDYLVDVTTVASTHSEQIPMSWLYILTKFKEKATSSHIMIGNAANFFLNELVNNPKADFEELRVNLYKMDPLSWAILDDDTVRNVLAALKNHFENLKRTIIDDFGNIGISSGNVYIEPTYYCREFGLQGRLDLIHLNKQRTKAEIIELKSGKIFKPNAYGINPPHYAQTLLYELLIKSAYKGKLRSNNYLLYSILPEDNLKLAPSAKTTDYELLKVRNEIILIEHAIAHDLELTSKTLNYLKADNFHKIKGFTLTELQHFEDKFQSLDTLEKRYFEHFTNFIAREHLLAKTGEHGLSRSNGLSALWLENIDEKIDRFGILNHLVIIENNADQSVPQMKLKKTKMTAQLSNFRVGDIAVLYPHQHNALEILHHEIFKCSILRISDEEVEVRFRHPQFNHQVFKDNSYWNLEQDVLDSAFRHMYRSLFEFASAPKSKRELLLGRRRPDFNQQDTLITLPEHLTAEQKSIIRKICNTKDYLLLWGPPGTGKTSMIIRNTAHTLFHTTQEVVIYLAYTNRAVDEICAALVDAGLGNDFIRIGSHNSIDPVYQPNLLDEVLKNSVKRSEILNKLKSTKIFVATIVSMSGKLDLFKIIKVDTAIIDEASQILEPSIIGLLTKFNRFILIGDDKQLPAVVTQNEAYTVVSDQTLKDAGIHDLRMSLFERMRLQLNQNNWLYALEVLRAQGRMHQHIMNFASDNFYEGKLKVIPNLTRLVADHIYPSKIKSSIKGLTEKRLLFFDSDVDHKNNWKVNENEARTVVTLIKEVFEIYKTANKPWNEFSLGVITPYRAQIALIRSLLDVDIPVTIDTVERYQGGARDVIIFSACTNVSSQLNRLISLSYDGVDRKLNVAITRSKEQFLLVGNKKILEQNQTYKSLIDSSYELKF